MSNGKGDKPRNCFSKQFRDNHDAINWGRDYYFVLEHGRPMGIDPTVWVGSQKEADSLVKGYSENSPCGTEAHRFIKHSEAVAFIQENVQETRNQVLFPPIRIRERRNEVPRVQKATDNPFAS